MTLMDLLKALSVYSRIMIDPYNEGRRTQPMKVGNITLDRVKDWLDWKVWTMNPTVDANGEPFLYVGIERNKQ